MEGYLSTGEAGRLLKAVIIVALMTSLRVRSQGGKMVPAGKGTLTSALRLPVAFSETLWEKRRCQIPFLPFFTQLFAEGSERPACQTSTAPRRHVTAIDFRFQGLLLKTGDGTETYDRALDLLDRVLRDLGRS